jgi:hypothetical protein
MGLVSEAIMAEASAASVMWSALKGVIEPAEVARHGEEKEG